MYEWQFCRSNIAVLINTHFVVGIHLPKVVSCPWYTLAYIPCYEADVNAFQCYHFVSKRVAVDPPVNVKKVVALEVLSTFLEKLQFESMNLCTKERLNTVIFTTSDARHKVDWLRGEFEYLFWRIGAHFPLALQIILSNIPPRLAIQGLDRRIINVLLVMVI
jgi:hypothetical protein